jgi:hypothetical protein
MLICSLELLVKKVYCVPTKLYTIRSQSCMGILPILCKGICSFLEVFENYKVVIIYCSEIMVLCPKYNVHSGLYLADIRVGKVGQSCLG